MATLRSKLSDWLALAGLFSIGAGVTLGALCLGFLIGLAMFAFVTALQALILWVVWNLTAPLFTFIAAEYQHFDFLTVWGAVAVVYIAGRILFGTFKKDVK